MVNFVENDLNPLADATTIDGSLPNHRRFKLQMFKFNEFYSFNYCFYEEYFHN